MSKAQSNQHIHTEKALILSIESKIHPLPLNKLDESAALALDYTEELTTNFKLTEKIAQEAIKQQIDPLALYETDPSVEFINMYRRASKAPEIKQNDLIKNPKILIELEEKLEKAKKDNPDFLSAVDPVKYHLTRRASLLNFCCLIVFKSQIMPLVQEGLSGKDVALCKAIHIDKSLVMSPKIKARIHKATLDGDQKFLSVLAKAISKKIDFKNTFSQIKLFHFIATMWAMGFYTLTDDELCFLINRYDFYQANPTQLRTFRNRYGFKKDRKTISSLNTLSAC